MHSTVLRLSTAAVLGLLLVGCGGAGSSGNSTPAAPTPPPSVPDPTPTDPTTPTDPDPGPNTPPATDASAGGIWRGVEPGTDLDIIGLVDENGAFHFINSEGIQYVGTATVATQDLDASLEGFTQLGDTYVDGSSHGTGTVSGTVDERTSMNLQFQYQTDGGTALSGNLDLTYDSLYERPSSLATVSGNYTNVDTGVVVSIASDGTMTSQDPGTSCVLNGTVSIINATYNLYGVAFEYASCQGSMASLNGVQFSGVATLDNTGTTEQAIVGVTSQGASKQAIAFILDRT